MQAWIIRLAGITAHFRDPRINTAKIGLPSRTLHSPPPCTIHGLICAARGGWVEPENLLLGWRIDYAEIATDFQTSRLPQRKGYNARLGTQKVAISPVEREFLSFPVLSILALNGIEMDWFRRPANPLSLGRSEDLIVEKLIHQIEVNCCDRGLIERQCLPIGLGSGTIYTAPLYFVERRRPIGMAPRTDAVQRQEVHSSEMVQIEQSGECFYVWNFKTAAR